MSGMSAEMEEGMCRFYRRDQNSPDWFYCVSPHHGNQRYRFCASGAGAGQFQYCIGCGRNGKRVCNYYFDPVAVQGQEPAGMGAGGGRRMAASMTAGRGMEERTEAVDGRTSGTAVSGGRASSRYSFGRARDQKQHMCQYWRRDEEQEKAYHCDSDGNPEGGSFKFPTTGLHDSVKRFRENCRRAENGVPPCCEYYPGGGFNSGSCEGGGEAGDDGTGEIVKKVVKAALKTAVNPAGSIVEGFATTLIDDL